MRGRPLDNYSPTRDVVAPSTRWVGRTFGRYRIRGVVEHDAESITLLADERREDAPPRPVWLRCLERSSERDDAARRRFEKEARLCLAARHTNLVAGLGRPAVDGQPALAMQCPGKRSWADVLRQCRNQGLPVPPALAVLVASRVAAGLDHAHRMTDPETGGPMLHGAIRPEVIHIDDDGWVRVSGFGREARPASKGALLNSLRHLAPEQSLADPVSTATDVYALAVVLAESLGGRPLFTSGDPKLLLADVVRGVRPVMADWLDFRATALEETLERGLAVKADDRYPTAASFSWALERSMAQLGAVADEADLAGFVAGLTKSTGDLVPPSGMKRSTPPPPPPPDPEEMATPSPASPTPAARDGRASTLTPVPEVRPPSGHVPRGAAPLDAHAFAPPPRTLWGRRPAPPPDHPVLAVAHQALGPEATTSRLRSRVAGPGAIGTSRRGPTLAWVLTAVAIALLV
jgi:serine/threonine-protein kinase